MNWQILRLANVYGPRQDPQGEAGVIAIFLDNIVKNLPLKINGDGLQTRCFSHYSDCIFCLEKLALDPNITSQIVNIGPDEGTITVKELAELVSEECNFHEPPIFMPDRPREVKHATCSAQKAKTLLGYQPKSDVRHSIVETIEYIKYHGLKQFDYSYPLEIISDKTPATWKDRLM